MMKVSSVMSRDVRLVGAEATLRDAARLMQEIDAGVLPVAEDDRLVGMITDRDLAIRGMTQSKRPDTKVREVMTQEVKHCYETEDVAHVTKNMAELQLRRLPVMKREKRLIGIVSLGDLATEAQTPRPWRRSAAYRGREECTIKARPRRAARASHNRGTR
jgi:CBS domain-containing protein